MNLLRYHPDGYRTFLTMHGNALLHFHFSVIAEDKLIDEHMKNMRISREEKIQKCHGILKLIEPCAHVLEVNFPLLRDDGR